MAAPTVFTLGTYFQDICRSGRTGRRSRRISGTRAWLAGPGGHRAGRGQRLRL